ncbi:MAG TPA: antibiotic biosynthesis monooxygenase [Draconibacterium sp.]|nr:antibiotic biosynthesis monooxygenase [Draconibacterium sp.]
MYIVHVNVHVKENFIDMFKILTVENAKDSLLEAGIVRFDIVQEHDNPAKFVLIEVYRSFEDTTKHKLTEHYMRWRDAVSNMMEEPRTSVKFYNVFPEDEGWE